jgi:hypothetical protein
MAHNVAQLVELNGTTSGGTECHHFQGARGATVHPMPRPLDGRGRALGRRFGNLSNILSISAWARFSSTTRSRVPLLGFARLLHRRMPRGQPLRLGRRRVAPVIRPIPQPFVHPLTPDQQQ